MSIAQKSIAVIAILAVVAAVFASLVATLEVAQAAGVCPGHTFSTNLKMGASSAEVMALQQFLNMDPATMVASTGAGSPGNESSYFGAKTKAAVIAFQNKYASDILAPNGLTVGNGNFFASSRAKATALCGGSTSTGPSTTPAGTGLTVAAGSQPANSLAPAGASRVPFTRITLTAGNDGDVNVNGVVVQRTGLGADAIFSGVILVDESTGAQLGNQQSFNSNHQATIGGAFTIPRGTSKSFLVAGNMTDSTTMASYNGQAPAVSVVSINTTATVTGSLPITGAYNTANSNLSVGTLTIATSNANASNSGQTVNIGDTGRKTTGFRLTAGSAEDVTLKMLRFYQTGSVSATDIANVTAMVGATAYPLTVSADGKYYSANLGSGVVITKGNQVDVYVKYDVVGGNAAGRTVIFDIDRNTDVLAYGNTYGYGISPAVPSGSSAPITRTTTSSAGITTGSPFFQAEMDTITGASVTTISKANEVPAQNIAINVQNQPLGGFVVDLKGEAITVQSMTFTIASSSGSGVGLLTNVTLVDENGSVVSGPYDATYTNSTTQTVTMSSSVTFNTGRHVYTLRGKVASTVGNGVVYTATTVPSGWTNVRGNTSGNSVTLSQGSFSMNPMTVKAAALTVGPSPSITSQNIVPGGQQVELARIVLDATQSGEDVRISSLPAALTSTNSIGSATDLTSCQLYNGASSLTTGSNAVNPTQAASSTNTFVLDNPFTVTKGSVSTLSLKCNVSGGATNASNYIWTPGTVNANGSVASYVGGLTVTGAVSGTTLASTQLTQGSGTAATFTIAAGAMTATAANASITQPSRVPVAAGSTGVTLGYVKFHATNEAVNLTKVGLTLANGLYGSKARGDGGSSNSGTGDIVTVYLYNGATQVGSVTFSGGQTATSTLSSAIAVPKDGDLVLTMKADLAAIGVSASGGIGDLIKVDPLNAEGTGASSGAVVAIGATSGVNGVQLVKSYPTVALGSGACTGNGCNGSNQIVKVFTVTANAAGPVSVYQTKVAIATSSASITDGKLFVYDQSGNQLSSTAYGASAGQFGSTACAAPGGCAGNTQTWTFTGTIPVQIPAGTSYTFKLLGTVTPGSTATNWSVISTVQGDSAVQTGLGTSPAMIATSTSAVNTANFVWSDNATTTAATTDVDWFNGFQVPGLSGNGI